MLNNILFLNEMRELKDIGDFYKSIDLFWQTSYIGESFGNVIAESFCFKVPVLTDYKHFYKNGRIRKKLYDAQIELVDNYKNGFYANYPETVINFFELNNIDSLKTMGKSGFNKVNYEYDVRNTCNSLAKVLYSYLLKYDLCKRDNIFESLKKVPLDHEVEIFESDYLRRIYSCLNNDNKINSYNRLVYLIEEKVWNIIEFGYVIVRKILMIFNYNLEGKK